MPSFNGNLNDTVGASFRATGLLWQWVQSVSINNYSPSGTGQDENTLVHFPYDAYFNIDQLPDIGDNHPTITDGYCIDVSVTPDSQSDPVNLRALINWISPGKRCEVSHDIYQTQEVTNYALDDNFEPTVLTRVVYTPTSGSIQTNVAIDFVADIRVPRILKSIRVTQYEVIAPAESQARSITETVPIFWNEDNYGGFDPGTLLYIGVTSQSEGGTPIYRRTYTFLYNERGWHHAYAIWKDARGIVPADIVPINPVNVKPDAGNLVGNKGNMQGSQYNGVAAYNTILGENFSNHSPLVGIKPPFNYSAS